jgi:hypothetical protein
MSSLLLSLKRRASALGTKLDAALQGAQSSSPPPPPAADDAPATRIEQPGATPDERRFLRSCGIRPPLIEFVIELAKHPETFSNMPLTEKDAGAFKELSPQQMQHATLALKHIPQLGQLRYKLCPSQIKEEAFWRNYFLLARQQLKWGDDDDAEVSGFELQDGVGADISTDPRDIVAACRAAAVGNDDDEAQAERVWCASVPPPNDALRNETYFDDFRESDWSLR